MGICIQRLSGENGPMRDESIDYTFESGWCWVVFRREPEPNEGCKHHDWHLQGIMTQEETAVGTCIDETYFIGPLPVNSPLPHSTVEWIGAYFPLAPDKKVT